MNTLSKLKVLLCLPALALPLTACHSGSGAPSTKLTQEESDALPEAMKKDTSMSDEAKKSYARDLMRSQVHSGLRQPPASQAQAQPQ